MCIFKSFENYEFEYLYVGYLYNYIVILTFACKKFVIAILKWFLEIFVN